MLIRFAVSNFRSIAERQELSLVASSYYKDRSEILIPCSAVPGGHLLPAAVIYGANAAGKSTLLEAVRFLQVMVVRSQTRTDPNEGIDRQPFALSNSGPISPTTFELEFFADDVRYQYGFEAEDRAFSAEWLYAYPHGHRQLLFERDANHVRFGRNLKGKNRVIWELTRPNSLFLSAAAQNSHDQLTKIHSYIASINIRTTGSNPAPISFRAEADNKYGARVIDFLKKIGTGIVAYRMKKRVPTDIQAQVEQELAKVVARFVTEAPADFAERVKNRVDYELELGHRSEARDDPVYFDVKQESAGTRRLLILLTAIFSVLDNGGVLFVDELDASLHTQICESILGLFSTRDTNPRGAQLVATTHDTNLMRSARLRRDQLWFTEKDTRGATHLYPLTDIRTRKSDNVERNYLQGRYGAVPFAGDVAALLED